MFVKENPEIKKKACGVYIRKEILGTYQKKNVRVGYLASIGRGRGKETSVWTRKPVWAMKVEKKRSNG